MFTKIYTGTSSDDEDSVSESEKGEAAEPRQVFEIETTAFSKLMLLVFTEEQMLRSRRYIIQAWRRPSSFGDQWQHSVSFLVTRTT